MLARAKLIYKSKQILNSGLVQEMVIWSVPVSLDYPEGIKYRFVLADPLWKKALLIFDNHSPKGPHWQDSTGREFPYKLSSISRLIDDFKNLEGRMEKNYESNED